MIAPASDHNRDESLDAAIMRRALRPDALRLACVHWFIGQPVKACQDELWLSAIRIERHRTGPKDINVREIVDDEIDVQIAWVGGYHDESWGMMRDAAAAALIADRDRLGVTEAAVEVAKTRTPLPAPYMVEQAVEAAAREHRFAKRFWRDRVRTE